MESILFPLLSDSRLNYDIMWTLVRDSFSIHQIIWLVFSDFFKKIDIMLSFKIFWCKFWMWNNAQVLFDLWKRASKWKKEAKLLILSFFLWTPWVYRRGLYRCVTNSNLTLTFHTYWYITHHFSTICSRTQLMLSSSLNKRLRKSIQLHKFPVSKFYHNFSEQACWIFQSALFSSNSFCKIKSIDWNQCRLWSWNIKV